MVIEQIHVNVAQHTNNFKLFNNYFNKLPMKFIYLNNKMNTF